MSQDVVAPLQTPVLRKVMPELDSVRGIAIILVFLFHSYSGQSHPELLHGAALRFTQFTTVGWTGVNLFFVLSGFLITGILLDSKDSSHYWRRFYVRRALRILPAYYLLLIILPLFALAPAMPEKVHWPFVGFSFIYLANMAEFFGVSMEYGPLWSLAVEEHFYIVWPLFVRRAGRSTLLAIAITVVALSPVIRAVTFSMGGNWNGTVRTWNSLDGLAFGAIFAIALRTIQRRSIARTFAIATFVLFTLAVAYGYSHGITATDPDFIGKALRPTAVNLFALCVVSSSLLIGSSDFARFIRPKWLGFLGYISYGFYLLHVLTLHVYDTVVGLPVSTFTRASIRAGVVFFATVALAWISRMTVEEWFLKKKELLDHPRS